MLHDKYFGEQNKRLAAELLAKQGELNALREKIDGKFLYENTILEAYKEMGFTKILESYAWGELPDKTHQAWDKIAERFEEKLREKENDR